MNYQHYYLMVRCSRQRCYLKKLLIVIGLLASVIPAPDFTSALAFEKKNVVFRSEPTDARICERERGTIVCFARTPSDLVVEFASASRTKKYYFRKIGYNPATVILKKTDKELTVRLKKRDILPLNKSDDNFQLKTVRAKVSQALKQTIYGRNAGIDDTGFDLIGRVGVFEFSERYYVGLGILLDDNFRKIELRSIRGVRERKKKQDALVRSVIKYGGGRLLNELAKAFKDIKELNDIVLSINYRKKKSVLADDIDRFTKHKVWQWQQGGYIYQKHFVYTQDVATTKVQDVTDMFEVIIRVDIENILKNKENCCESIISLGEIYLNDNRKKKMERY